MCNDQTKWLSFFFEMLNGLVKTQSNSLSIKKTVTLVSNRLSVRRPQNKEIIC